MTNSPAPDPATAVATTDPRPLDAHGFDPHDYEWLPVPRQRRRTDGWSIPLQRRFIEALADTGSVTSAAEEVGMSKQSCYRLRRAPDAAGFARAWDAAMDQAGRAMLDLAFDRIIHGEDIPVFNQEGQRIASKRRYSDRLTMFLLRGFFPDRFGSADERIAARRQHTPGGPALPSLIDALEPVCPAEPHKLMPPDEFAAFLADEAANALEEERFEAEQEARGVAEKGASASP